MERRYNKGFKIRFFKRTRIERDNEEEIEREREINSELETKKKILRLVQSCFNTFEYVKFHLKSSSANKSIRGTIPM